MEYKEEKMGSEVNKKIMKIYAEFMTGITKFDELVAEGGRLLAGFQQGLEFLRRPPVDMTSKLFENIIKSNETKRLKSYIEAGCINANDGIQNMTKLNTCQSGLHDHLSKARSLLNELESLAEDVSVAMQTANGMLSPLLDKDYGIDSKQEPTEIEAVEFQAETASSQLQKPDITDIVALIAIIFCMVKQDFAMQERIVRSLNLKTPSGELETYCMMWSLRPFVSDEIMQQAWKNVA